MTWASARCKAQDCAASPRLALRRGAVQLNSPAPRRAAPHRGPHPRPHTPPLSPGSPVGCRPPRRIAALCPASRRRASLRTAQGTQ